MTFALWACLAASLGADGPRPIVALTFVGDEDDRIAFAGSLSELLLRLDVDIAQRQTDAPLPKDALLAIVTADWSDPAAVTVNIQDAQSHVVLVRRLTRGASPSLVIEAAAHIVQSLIEELANPTAPKLSAPPVLSAAVVMPKPLEPQRPKEGVSLSVAGFAGARLFGVQPEASLWNLCEAGLGEARPDRLALTEQPAAGSVPRRVHATVAAVMSAGRCRPVPVSTT